jgi:glutathione S-transferase
MITLYDDELSTSAHAVRNLLSLLDVAHVRHTSTHPSGDADRIAIVVDADIEIRGSCAILVYLGRKVGRGRWLPVDAAGEGQVQQWLAVSRWPRERLVACLHARLRDHPYLVGRAPTIADIACYTPAKLAAGSDGHGAVRDWLARLETLPGFVVAPAPQHSSPRPS